MVRVPTYDGPQVRPQPFRAEQNIRAPEAAFGGATAQALQRFGQDVGQVAALMDRRAQEQGREDAELQAFNAYTTASMETQRLFYEGDTAIYQRRGAQAMGASNEAAVELRRIGQDTAATLTSPYARQNFEKLWLRHQDSELGAVSRHEAGQRREYRDQTTAGVLATSTNLAALRYNDPAEIANQIEIGTLAIRANAKGLPPEQVNAQVLKFTSGIHKAVVLRMATDNPLAAQKYYREHADEFDADDNVALQRTLAPTVKRAEARQSSGEIIKQVTSEQASAPDTLYGAVEATESSGRQNAVSSAGNFGVMQINDVSGAEAAKALGIAYDPKRAREDAAYNRQLGRKYLDIQLERYNGNRALALAAYNAGPGKVDEWIAQFGDPRTGAISDAAWAAKIPYAETRQYVARVEGKIGAGSDDNVDLTKAYEIAREKHGDDPEMLDAVEGDITKESNRREAARRDREQQALTTAWKHVNAGGSVDSLPPEVVAGLPYGRRSDLEARERSLLKGREPPENPAEYDRLTVLALTDFERFKAEKASDWEKVLPAAQVRHFIDMKFRLEQQDAKELAKAADMKRGLSLSRTLLTQAGIDPTPKDKDKAGAERLNAFGSALLGRMQAFADKEQRKPSDAEVMEMSRDLLLPGRLRDAGWFGTDPATLAFEATTPEQLKQFYVPFDKIPAAEKADITAALGPRATNDLVERIYAEVRRGNKAEVQRLIAPPTQAKVDTAPNPFVPPAGSVVVPVR